MAIEDRCVAHTRCFDRREFLRFGGVVVASAAFMNADPWIKRAVAATPDEGLTSERQVIVTAIVEALSEAPNDQVREVLRRTAAPYTAATASFARIYASSGVSI